MVPIFRQTHCCWAVFRDFFWIHSIRLIIHSLRTRPQQTLKNRPARILLFLWRRRGCRGTLVSSNMAGKSLRTEASPAHVKDQKGSNDFAVQSKCVTAIYRTSSLANQIRCLRKNHLRLTIYHYISMKRQVFDMEMDQKPLPSGYLTDCHGKKFL